MKKVLIISGCIILAVSIAIASYFLFFVPKDEEQPQKQDDVIALSTEDEIKAYIDKNEISIYDFEEDIAYLLGIDVFGQGADVEFYLTEKKVKQINVTYYLFFPGLGEEYLNENDIVENDGTIYQFTQEDKDNITNKFNSIKDNFEQYIGCYFEKYDLVPTHNTETLEDTDESFYNGDFIKEYSVRDADGVLWIMQYEASMGTSTVVISKIVDESNFEGFIPAIDLTK